MSRSTATATSLRRPSQSRRAADLAALALCLLLLGGHSAAASVPLDFTVEKPPMETLIPTTLPVTLADIRRARQLAKRYPTLRTRDLIHAAVMLENGLTHILSTDCHFDQMREIKRLDPREFSVAVSKT